MKRSEMIRIILEAQSDCPDRETAEHILKMIEGAGMSPPLREYTEYRFIQGDWVRDWEPEND